MRQFIFVYISYYKLLFHINYYNYILIVFMYMYITYTPIYNYSYSVHRAIEATGSVFRSMLPFWRWKIWRHNIGIMRCTHCSKWRFRSFLDVLSDLRCLGHSVVQCFQLCVILENFGVFRNNSFEYWEEMDVCQCELRKEIYFIITKTCNM